MDGGAWWPAVHGVAEGRTRLSDFTFTFHFHALEKDMATHSSVLAWTIPGMGDPGGLPSMGSHRVGQDWATELNWTELRTKNIHMETQKTLNSQSSLEKKEWSWRNHPFWLQIILQSYSHQDSTVLAQKQKYRSMEQDIKPQNKPMLLWVPYFWQRRQEYTIGQRKPL